MPMFGSALALTSHQISSFKQLEQPLGTQMDAADEYHAGASCIASLTLQKKIGKYAGARLSCFVQFSRT